MSKAFEDDDRGAAERAMLYGHSRQLRQTENDNHKEHPARDETIEIGNQQTQIVKLLEQIRNRLSDVDKERAELWEAINDQTNTLNKIEDRSDKTEKSFVSLEDRLSKNELGEAPLVERLDNLERDLKNKSSEGDGELRKDILNRMEESDLQTARLIERIDEAMAMQSRMTRRIDKVVQDKQRLNRKISLLEESVQATRDALSAKAMVLLTDKGIAAQSETPSIPIFQNTKGYDDIYSSDELKSPAAQSALFEPPEKRKKDHSFRNQAIAASLFAITAATAGWFISHKINATPQAVQISEYQPTQQTPLQETATPSSTSYNAPEFTKTQPASISSAPTNLSPTYESEKFKEVYEQGLNPSISEEELATELNNIAPSTESESAQSNNIQITKSEEPTAQKTPETNTQEVATAPKPSPQVFEGDENLPASLKAIEVEAFKGDPEAQHDLAVVYTAGRDNIPQDFEKAAYWFKKASNQGIANARYNLGVLYHQGLGVEQDLKEAINWYQKAAQLGHAEAQYNLGIAFIEGIGVDYDPSRAADYFEAAAASGVPEAAFNLGLIYENGLMGTAQPDEAILWYKTASDLGNTDARNAMEQLAKSLNIRIEDIDNVVKELQTPHLDEQSQYSVSGTVNNAQRMEQNSNSSSLGVISEIQEHLMSFGLFPGPVNGNYDPLTADAIRLYQARHNIPVDGRPSEELLAHMLTKNLRGNSAVELGSGE